MWCNWPWTTVFFELLYRQGGQITVHSERLCAIVLEQVDLHRCYEPVVDDDCFIPAEATIAGPTYTASGGVAGSVLMCAACIAALLITVGLRCDTLIAHHRGSSRP